MRIKYFRIFRSAESRIKGAGIAGCVHCHPWRVKMVKLSTVTLHAFSLLRSIEDRGLTTWESILRFKDRTVLFSRTQEMLRMEFSESRCQIYLDAIHALLSAQHQHRMCASKSLYCWRHQLEHVWWKASEPKGTFLWGLEFNGKVSLEPTEAQQKRIFSIEIQTCLGGSAAPSSSMQPKQPQEHVCPSKKSFYWHRLQLQYLGCNSWVALETGTYTLSISVPGRTIYSKGIKGSIGVFACVSHWRYRQLGTLIFTDSVISDISPFLWSFLLLFEDTFLGCRSTHPIWWNRFVSYLFESR